MIDLERRLILLLIVDMRDPMADSPNTNTNSVFLSVLVLQSDSRPKEEDDDNTISDDDDHIYWPQRLLLCELIVLFILYLLCSFVDSSILLVRRFCC